MSNYTTSTAISAVGYNPWSRQMDIWFTSGGPYTFYGVPSWIYEGLMSAPSMGRYYNLYIRGRYRYP